MPLFVAGAGAVPSDADVHPVASLEAEAPYDLLVVAGGPVGGLLVPGGVAVLAGEPEDEAGVVSAAVGRGLSLAVRCRL